MIRKHVDLIALAVLMLGMAVYYQVRNVARVEIAPTGQTGWTARINHHLVVIPNPHRITFWCD